MDDYLDQGIPLLDALDLEILMHRDAHFGGSFRIMIEYYENHHVGVMPDFSLHRLHKLEKVEKSMEESLSSSMLPLPAKEAVERSKKLYHDLREVYESTSKDTEVARLLSDLILSEEENPTREINALVEHADIAVDPLLHLLNSKDFYDPLNPGYGRAPIFAAKALALIQNPKAIPYLFSALGQDDFFADEDILIALKAFGKEAKAFLLPKLSSKPFNKENEHAVIALSMFHDDLEIARACLALLQDKSSYKHESFSVYLLFGCAVLDEKGQKEFCALKEDGLIPQSLMIEYDGMVKSFSAAKKLHQNS